MLETAAADRRTVAAAVAKWLTGMNVVERMLHEIAHIGDRRARPAMEKLSEDPSFSKQVRGLAGEIAFQMKYARVP